MAVVVWIICLQNSYDVYILDWTFYHQSKLLVLLSIDINECEFGGDDCHMYAVA